MSINTVLLATSVIGEHRPFAEKFYVPTGGSQLTHGGGS